MSFTAEDEDDDVAQKVVDSLEENKKQIYNQLKLPNKMIFIKEFNAAFLWHTCGGELGTDGVRTTVT